MSRTLNTATARLALFIERQRAARGVSSRQLAESSGWSKTALTSALNGGAVGFQPLADMLQVFGFHLVIESTDDRLPLSLDQLRTLGSLPVKQKARSEERAS